MAIPSPLFPTRLGHYLVGEQIGAGGMGRVFRARDERLERDVAIKVLPPGALQDESARRHFRNEALSISKLNHPNIATIFELDREEDIDFLVMEYISGAKLDERLAGGPLSEREISRLGVQLAEGLQAAHKEGVVHLDLKPGNLRLTPDGRLKILDFGLARLVQRPSEDSAQATQTEVSISPSGTLPYMAPEQLRDEQVDTRADIWASGAVLYEMATGRRPFAQFGFKLVDDILHGAPPPPSSRNRHVSPALESIILKCLEKSPEDRYQSATELAVDLRRLASTETVPFALTRKPRQNRLWLWAIGAGALLAIISVVMLLMPGTPKMLQKLTGRKGLFGSTSRSIAVLPFNPAGENDSMRAFSDGLAETTAAKLTHLSSRYPIQVVSPSEVRDQGVSTAEQARDLLGVDLVLTGALRGSGNQVRVNYRLVDVQTRRELRGDTVTADIADLFSMEDRVVESVLAGLEIVLAPGDKQALAAHRTAEPKAYDFYLQGRGYLLDYHKPESVNSAVAVFQQALTRDPRYGDAYAGLGQAYLYQYELDKNADWLNKAHDTCEHAVQLDESAAGGHLCLGMVDYHTGKYDDAARELTRSTNLEPNSAEGYRWLGKAYEANHDVVRAEATFKQAVALRRDYWGGYNGLGSFYFRQSRLPDALAQFKQVVSLAPDNFRAYSNIGGVYLAMGDYDKAIQSLERSIALRPTADALSNLGIVYFYQRRYADSARAYAQATQLTPNEQLLWGNLGEAYYWIPGKRAESERALKEALRLVNEDLRVNPRDPDGLRQGAGYYAMLGNKPKAMEYLKRGLAVAPADAEMFFRAAMVHALFGEKREAVEWLRKAVSAGYGIERIRDDPAFGSLKGDSGFEAMVQQK